MVSITFTPEIYLGEIIHVFRDVLDDQIYQNSSSIILTNLSSIILNHPQSYKNYPFTYDRANRLETICLFCLILVLIIVIFESHTNYPKLVSVIMTVNVLLPILVIFVCIMGVIRNYFRVKSGVKYATGSEYVDERVEKWKNRMTQMDIIYFYLFNQYFII